MEVVIGLIPVLFMFLRIERRLTRLETLINGNVKKEKKKK